MRAGEEIEMETGQRARSEAEQASSRVDASGGPPEPLPAPSGLGLWTAALQCLKAANMDKVSSFALMPDILNVHSIHVGAFWKRDCLHLCVR